VSDAHAGDAHERDAHAGDARAREAGAHDDGRRATRQRVAALVRDLYDGRIGSSHFFREVDALDTRGDPDVAELLELIRHANAESWFFGVGRTTVHDDGARVAELVKKLLA
jgi:hypothetical protein